MSNNINLVGIPINLNVLIKQIRQDMRDDWFPDPLHYEDILKPDTIKSYFNNHIQNGPSKYKCSNAYQYNIPKQGFVLRYALETTIYDRLIYQALTGFLIKYYDKHLKNCVFSHRWSKQPKSKYIFKHPIESWKSYQSTVKVNLSGTYQFLLVTDIQNFFENIRIEDIQNALKYKIKLKNTTATEKKRISKTILLIVNLLKYWTPYEKHGIPQNRDASSFLGNILLHCIDCEMLNKGYKYFRYMDDVRVVCIDEFHARKALKDLIIELRKIGLNVNAKKTFILSKNDEKINEFIIKPNRKIEQIDELWKSKKLQNIKKTLPMLRNFVLKIIDDEKTQSREFRFCIHRLENIARCSETKSSFNFSSITEEIIKELTNQPYSSDSFVRYLKSVDLEESHFADLFALLSDNSKSIYGWQNFHLWQLFVNHKHVTEDLREMARQNLKNSNISIPNMAGSISYLGACGTNNDRIYVAKCFKKFNDFITQRCAMIATHELKYENHIKTLVKPYVKNELKGTYKNLSSSSFRGTYFRPLEPIKVSDIYRDIPAYN